jgi:hypothetical protein
MKVPWFAEHMREELVLHGWDITGDDAAARARLDERWMTEHSVEAVGEPLLRRGCAALDAALDFAVDGPIEARLRVAGLDDVIVSAGPDRTDIALGPAEGEATMETDAAARVLLLLWGRRPADPSRVVSGAGPQALGRVRARLSGY